MTIQNVLLDFSAGGGQSLMDTEGKGGAVKK